MLKTAEEGEHPYLRATRYVGGPELQPDPLVRLKATSRPHRGRAGIRLKWRQ